MRMVAQASRYLRTTSRSSVALIVCALVGVVSGCSSTPEGTAGTGGTDGVNGYEGAPDKYPTIPDDGPVDLSVPAGAILTGQVNVSVGQNETKRFVFTKEAGKHYTIGLSQLSSDLDLFSHWLPDVSRSNHQFASWAFGTTDEQIDFTASDVGDYFIAVHGYEAGQGLVQLFVTSPGSGGVPTDEVGWPVEWGNDTASQHDLVGGGLGWLEEFDYGGDCGVTRHPALDMNFGAGTDDLGKPVMAVADGVVTGSGYDPKAWGNVITVKHKLASGVQFVSLYGHLQDRLVETGAMVVRGKQIGTVGKPVGKKASPHLHFEIRRNMALKTFAFPCKWPIESVEAAYAEPAEFIRTH